MGNTVVVFGCTAGCALVGMAVLGLLFGMPATGCLLGGTLGLIVGVHHGGR